MQVFVVESLYCRENATKKSASADLSVIVRNSSKSIFRPYRGNLTLFFFVYSCKFGKNVLPLQRISKKG